MSLISERSSRRARRYLAPLSSPSPELVTQFAATLGMCRWCSRLGAVRNVLAPDLKRGSFLDGAHVSWIFARLPAHQCDIDNCRLPSSLLVHCMLEIPCTSRLTSFRAIRYACVCYLMAGWYVTGAPFYWRALGVRCWQRCQDFESAVTRPACREYEFMEKMAKMICYHTIVPSSLTVPTAGIKDEM